MFVRIFSLSINEQTFHNAVAYCTEIPTGYQLKFVIWHLSYHLGNPCKNILLQLFPDANTL